MPRPTVARIDLQALKHNFRRARELAGATRAMAVVKADGYGHGINAVAGALAPDTSRFAVACIEEAVTIREAGHQHSVVLLQGVHQRGDLAECEQAGFEPVLHNQEQLSWLGSGCSPRFWIKVNTGMNRLGFRPGELPDVMSRLDEVGLKNRVIGFVTHFACADDFASEMTGLQTRIFEQAVAPWPDLMRSVGNSAAHFRPNQPLYEWSRPGIMLYGASPMEGKTGKELGLCR